MIAIFSLFYLAPVENWVACAITTYFEGHNSWVHGSDGEASLVDHFFNEDSSKVPVHDYVISLVVNVLPPFPPGLLEILLIIANNFQLAFCYFLNSMFCRRRSRGVVRPGGPQPRGDRDTAGEDARKDGARHEARGARADRQTQPGRLWNQVQETSGFFLMFSLLNGSFQCMCEVQGQHPCTALLHAPKYMTGKWRWNHNLI